MIGTSCKPSSPWVGEWNIIYVQERTHEEIRGKLNINQYLPYMFFNKGGQTGRDKPFYHLFQIP
jgi:hypothetical protein